VLLGFDEAWNICRKIFRNFFQTPNFMKIRPVEVELFQADGQTDRHEEASSRFKQGAW
jgi:hypothetical protein